MITFDGGAYYYHFIVYPSSRAGIVTAFLIDFHCCNLASIDFHGGSLLESVRIMNTVRCVF